LESLRKKGRNRFWGLTNLIALVNIL